MGQLSVNPLIPLPSTDHIFAAGHPFDLVQGVSLMSCMGARGPRGGGGGGASSRIHGLTPTQPKLNDYPSSLPQGSKIFSFSKCTLSPPFLLFNFYLSINIYIFFISIDFIKGGMILGHKWPCSLGIFVLQTEGSMLWPWCLYMTD
jgi:hypothetical protein